MRKSAKKLLSGVLAGLMVVSMAPISAMAASYEPGDVVAEADYVTAADIAPEVDIVWTAYTGLNKAFIMNGDEEWTNSAENDTYADLSKVDLTGKTANSTDFPAAAIKSGKYYVTASFILKNYGGQFGDCTLSFGWDDALTMGKRTAKGFTAGDCGMLAPSYSNVSDADGNPYLIDAASKYNDTYYALSIATPHLPETGSVVYVGNDYTFETDGPLGGADDLGVKLEGLYLGTVGFQVAEGTVISDELLKFGVQDWPANDPGLCNLHMGSADPNRMYTFTGMTEYEGTTPAMGTLKIAGNSAPETKSYTVNYVTEDGASLGTENVEEGKSPASVPALPTKAPDAAGHYSYAWNVDPTTAVINADTTFTAKATCTPHIPVTADSNIVDATCGKDGSKTVTTTCSDCSYVISVENNVVIPATGNHTPAEAVKENVKHATCTTPETYDLVVKCSVCGDVISTTPTTGEDALGHQFGQWKHDDSTAKAESQHIRTCERCNEQESAACKFTPQVTQNQTADLPEITTYTCSVCGYSYTEETKPALGHTHNYGAPVADYTSGEAYVQDKDYTHTATCTGEGTCSQPTKTDACNFDNGVVTKEATCTEDGVKTFTCSECGGTYTVAIPAIGHAWGQWSHDSATAEAASTHTRTCKNDATHTENQPCDFISKVTQEATLDQAEITTYTCSVCGYSYSKQTAPALAGVTVTVNAAENGAVSLGDVDVTAGGAKKFAENGMYTLTATPNEGCSFVGWQTGNKIVSTDATYTTVAVADITYKAVFAEAAKPVQFTFVDMFNNVISSQPVASGADVRIPQAPTYTGYTFTGWSVDEAAIKAATGSMTVYAQYEKDAAATYTVTSDDATTITNGAASATGSLADVAYGSQVTVTNDNATAWTIDGKTVAYGSSYTFYVVSDVTVKAATAATQEPVVAAVATNAVGGDSCKVEFIATREMTDGYTFLKAGFVYGKNLTDDDLALAKVGKPGSLDNSGVVKAAYANSAEGSTQFILSYGIASKTGTASAKAFLTFKDQHGTVKTVYSDVMAYDYV